MLVGISFFHIFLGVVLLFELNSQTFPDDDHDNSGISSCWYVYNSESFP